MPVYNAEQFLSEALDSVSTQTLTDIEILVIDDGSTDASPAILQRHAKIDPRIRIIHKENGGISEALNLGVAESRAPLIARMDADDVMAPGRLTAQADFMALHPEVGFCGCNYDVIDAESRPFGHVRPRPRNAQDLESMIAEKAPLSFTHPTITYRRDLVLAAGGYDKAMEPTEDMDLFARMMLAGAKPGMVPRTLMYYRVHGGSISARGLWAQMRKREFVRRNFYLQRDGKPPITLAEAERAVRSPRSLSELNDARILACDYQKKMAFFAQAGDRWMSHYWRLGLAAALRPGKALAVVFGLEPHRSIEANRGP